MSALAPLAPRSAPLAPAEIEAALEQAWREAAQTDGAPAPTRVRTLNLVAFVADDETAARVEAVLAALPARHPGRAIVLRVVEGQQEEILACISARCRLDRGQGRQVCSEEIYVSARTDAVDRLPAAALPLLVTDLPVFLWWACEPALDDGLFRSLVHMADRLIIDSQALSAPGTGIPLLANRLRERAMEAIVGDLAWGRTGPWREVVAQFFDSPETLPYLQQLDRVTIGYAAGHPAPVLPLLVAGWLASRLGWRLAAGARAASGWCWQMDTVGRKLALQFSPAPRAGLAAGSLLSVDLEAGAGGVAARFLARLDERDPGRLETRIEAGGRWRQERVVQLEAADELRLVSDELDALAPDVVYEAAVLAAAGLIAAVG